MKPWKVGLNLIKCAVGAGSFSLPEAFKEGGVWGSSVGTVILGGLAAYTFCILADAEKHFARKDRYNRRFTYPQVCGRRAPTLAIRVLPWQRRPFFRRPFLRRPSRRR